MDVVGSFCLRIADLLQGVNIIFEQNGVDSLNFYELVGVQRTILRATCIHTLFGDDVCIHTGGRVCTDKMVILLCACYVNMSSLPRRWRF